MAIIVHSPHDGYPVKVRDQDLGRAIRDNEGRIFYAVPRSDGNGYYGALTRKGSEKDEQRYVNMLDKMGRAKEVGAQMSAEQIHDATGKTSSRGPMRWAILILLLGLLALGAWLLLTSNNNLLDGLTPEDTTPPTDTEEIDDAGGTEVSYRTAPISDAELDRLTRGYVATSSGLRYKILKPGTGEAAVAGRYARVRYSVSTLAGETIEATSGEKTVGFVLWSGHAPRGWEEGVTGMRVGEIRQLVFGPDLQEGPYPGRNKLPNTPLRFDIELVDVLPGVRHTTIQDGQGPVARPGDTVFVHYQAFLNRENTAYDSSRERGGPVQFRIGTGEVIPGWELGVIGMAEGETRTIEIPSYLAYGPRGAAGIIPPNAGLRYTVELMHISGPSTRQADAGR